MTRSPLATAFALLVAAACGGDEGSTSPALTVPGAPTLTGATPGNGSATLAFTAPASAGGGAITAYSASCAPSGGAPATHSGSASPITVSGLANGTSYSCTVAATNAVGTGLASAPLSVTPATTPGAPTGLVATAGNGQLTLIFAAPGSTGGAAISGYTASCTAAGATVTATGTASPLTVMGLTNGTAHSCTVAARNEIGAGAASAAVTATPTAGVTAPTAPRNVVGSAGVNDVVLSFDAPGSTGGAAITGYVASCTAGTATRTASGAASPLTVTGLAAGVAYSCAVTALNSAGSSPASTAVTVTPVSVVTVPGAPTLVALTPGPGAVTLAFTAPTSAGGAPITAYVATCTAGASSVSATGTGSPLPVTGLANGSAYSCTVVARNGAGTGPASNALSATPQSAATTAGVWCDVSYSAPNASAAVNLTATYAWSCSATSRALTGNGVPNHPVTRGNFATRVGAVTVSQLFTMTPAVTSASGTFERGTIGFAVNSVKFDPATDGGCMSTATGTGMNQGCVAAGAGGQGAVTYPWALEALGGAFQFGTDESNAHTQPSGAYHYHGMPEELLPVLQASATRMTLVGFALDGFPMYARYGHDAATDPASPLRRMTSSWQKKATPDAGRPSTATFPMGTFRQDYEYRAGSGDLDECNGRFGVTPEFPSGIYHYYVTETYPFIQRCWKGR